PSCASAATAVGMRFGSMDSAPGPVGEAASGLLVGFLSCSWDDAREGGKSSAPRLSVMRRSLCASRASAFCSYSISPSYPTWSVRSSANGRIALLATLEWTVLVRFETRRAHPREDRPCEMFCDFPSCLRTGRPAIPTETHGPASLCLRGCAKAGEDCFALI